MSSSPSWGAVESLADSLPVIYRGHEFEPQPDQIAVVESDHEIISFSLPLIQRRAVVGYWRKYMYVLSVLVTPRNKPIQEKCE